MTGLSGPEALRLRTACERYKRRAETAEATLAEVRAWLDESNTLRRDDLRAILNKKETP